MSTWTVSSFSTLCTVEVVRQTAINVEINQIHHGALFARQPWRSRPTCSWRGCPTRTRLRFDRSSSAASGVSSICEMPTTLMEPRVKRLPPGGRDQPGLPRTWHRTHIQVKPITSCEKSPLLYKTFHFQNLCDNFPWLWSKWGSCSPSQEAFLVQPSQVPFSNNL